MKECSVDEIMAKLQAPFPSADIEWRVQQVFTSQDGRIWAKVLAYVTNRAIQKRLDEVFGPGGWKNEFRDFQGGILCTISCLINGQWVSKTDGAEKTAFESFKGGLSSAMKRAAVQWGIGRYLYDLPVAIVEVFKQKKEGAIRIVDKKNNISGYWLPPKLPDWALPEKEATSQKEKPLKNQQTSAKNKPPVYQDANRRKLVNGIENILKDVGLKQKPDWIMRLFKRINPTLNQTSLIEIYQNATLEELEHYYSVLRPVHDLKIVADYYKVALKDVLRYVQDLIPQHKVDSLISCFTHVTMDHVKQVVEFIKEDLQNGSLQQIA
ncbi:MAG: hypothetical protein BAA00_06055 [Parageobacillus thermoglucosidasius]|jgi:hypothetical protein|nr:MAG: hypothetical protein BAA00_06055 [Parageobacillus thermoglucosidasius]